MAVQVYRDVAAADGAEAVAELVHRLTQLSNGFTFLAYGTGTGGARTAGYPGSAALLATQLKLAQNSWVAWQKNGRTWSLRRFNGGTDYGTWVFEYSASGTPAVGTATVPDRVTSTTATSTIYQVVSNSQRPLAPAVSSAMKCHILIENSASSVSFALITRRTPFPAGNNGFYAAVICDQVTSSSWAGNPDPVVMAFVGAGGDTSDTQMGSSGYMSTWRFLGTSNASWTGALLENPGAISGATAADPGGQDVVLSARWVYTGTSGISGVSSLFFLLQPGRTPIGGIDAGATWSHAAFWTVAVLNDGSPLTT
jgi:hypothetical protein